MSGRRRGLPVAVVGALAVVLVVVLGTAQAQSPTPTPTDSPSPSPTATVSPATSPSPTPFRGPTSTIAIRFVRGGQLQQLNVRDPIISAEGVRCDFPRVPEPSVRSLYSIGWPAGASPNFADECEKDPPTRVRFEFEFDSGVLSVETTWTGSDVTIDLEVPATTTTAPTLPAVELPVTGGRP